MKPKFNILTVSDLVSLLNQLGYQLNVFDSSLIFLKLYPLLLDCEQWLYQIWEIYQWDIHLSLVLTA